MEHKEEHQDMRSLIDPANLGCLFVCFSDFDQNCTGCHEQASTLEVRLQTWGGATVLGIPALRGPT